MEASTNTNLIGFIPWYVSIASITVVLIELQCNWTASIFITLGCYWWPADTQSFRPTVVIVTTQCALCTFWFIVERLYGLDERYWVYWVLSTILFQLMQFWIYPSYILYTLIWIHVYERKQLKPTAAFLYRTQFSFAIISNNSTWKWCVPSNWNIVPFSISTPNELNRCSIFVGKFIRLIGLIRNKISLLGFI